MENGGYPQSTIYAGEVGGGPRDFGQQIAARGGLPADLEREINKIESHHAEPRRLLDRTELDALLDSLTAGDLMRAQRAVGDDATRMVGLLLTAAAKRSGLLAADVAEEDAALDLIRLADIKYLTDRIGGTANPTTASTEPSPNSASTGA